DFTVAAAAQRLDQLVAGKRFGAGFSREAHALPHGSAAPIPGISEVTGDRTGGERFRQFFRAWSCSPDARGRAALSPTANKSILSRYHWKMQVWRSSRLVEEAKRSSKLLLSAFRTLLQFDHRREVTQR